MASISTTAKGFKRILFVDPNGKRKSIYIGKISKRDAETLRLRVESLLSTRILRKEPDRDTSFWLNEIDSVLRSKLESVGLVDLVEPVEALPGPSLSSFLEHFMDKSKEGKKPATLIVWGQVIAALNANMPKGIALADVTTGHAIQFANKLKARKLAQSTIYKRVGFAKQFFQFAVNWELIPNNPFESREIKAKVRQPSSKSKSNVEVPLATINTVLAFADPVWKGIIGLSRFGGLRCPSEVLTLTWGNVDFDKRLMTFTAPKNEHHDDEGIRVCPLFTELRPILDTLYALATVDGIPPSPEAFVIDKPGYRSAANTPNGWANANLRTQFLKLLKRAGVTPWKRIFHSMRATRQTELEARFPLHVVCSWLGNSQAVAKASYLLTSEAHFYAATDDAHNDAPSVINDAQTTQYTSAPSSVLPQIIEENTWKMAISLGNMPSMEWRITDLNR